MLFVLRTDMLTGAGEALWRRLCPAGRAFIELPALQWRRPVSAMTCTQPTTTPVVALYLRLLLGAA